MTDKSEYYVDKDHLAELIQNYYDTDDFSKELADTVLLMCKNILGARNFCGYSPLWKEEMLDNGYYKATRAILGKNVRGKSAEGVGDNAFGYITATIHRAYVETLLGERNRFNALQEYKEEVRANAKDNIQNRRRSTAEVADLDNDEPEENHDD